MGPFKGRMRALFGGGSGDQTESVASERSGAAPSQTEFQDGVLALACSDARAYAAELLDGGFESSASNRSSFPILGSAAECGGGLPLPGGEVRIVPSQHLPSGDALTGSAESDVYAAMADRVARPAVVPEALCAVLDREGFTLVAAAHALAAGKALFRFSSRETLRAELNRRPGWGSLTVVLDDAFLAQHGLGWLIESLEGEDSGPARNERHGPWGILSAATPEELSRRIAQIHLRRPAKDVRGEIYEFDAFPPMSLNIGGLQVLPGLEFQGDVARRLAQTAPPFLAIRSHGRVFCAARGNLCMGERRPPDGELRCVGGMDCTEQYYTEDVPGIHARELRADVVLLDSCASGNHVAAPTGRSLAGALLEGSATAVFATYRSSNGVLMTPILAWVLCRLGWRLGEIARFLNDCTPTDSGERGSFVLFGDPEATAFDVPRRDAVPLTVTRIGSGAWSAAAALSDPPATLFVSEAHELLADIEDVPLHVFSAGEGEPGVVAQAFPLRQRGQLFVLALHPETTGKKIAIALSGAPAVRAARVAAASELAERTSRFPVPTRPPGPEGGWPGGEPSLSAGEELIGWLGEYERLLATSPHRPILQPGSYQELARAEASLVELGCRANLELLGAVRQDLEHSALMINRWLEQRGGRLLSDRRSAHSCPYCAAALEERTYRIGVLPAEERRLLECEGCEAVIDEWRGAPWFQLDGPKVVPRGALARYVVRGCVPAEPAESFVHSLVEVFHGEAAPGRYEIEPGHAGGLEAAGESIEHVFYVDVPEAAPLHRYYFKSLVSINGQLIFLFRSITVSEP